MRGSGLERPVCLPDELLCSLGCPWGPWVPHPQHRTQTCCPRKARHASPTARPRVLKSPGAPGPGQVPKPLRARAASSSKMEPQELVTERPKERPDQLLGTVPRAQPGSLADSVSAVRGEGPWPVWQKVPGSPRAGSGL